MTIEDVKSGIRSWRLTRLRAICFATGITAILLYEFVGRPIYRPYIYQNRINDFHIADTLGNSLGTIATIFVFLGILGQTREQHLVLIRIITISMVLFEIAHPLLGKPIDVWDVIATAITGTLCYFLYRAVTITNC